MKSCNLLLTSTLSLTLALALSSPARAATIAIANNSFETTVASLAADGNNTNSGAGAGTFNSWGFNVQNGASFEDFGIENAAPAAYTGATGAGTPTGANGTNVAYLNNNNAGLYTSIFQDVGILQANTLYTLTIAIGQRLDRVNGSVQIALINAAAGNTDPFGTGTILNSTTGVSLINGTFQDFVASFSTGGSVTGDLYVAARYTANGTVQGSLDNVRLDGTAVPEPTTGVMLLGGVGMLLGFRRSRRS